MALEALDIQFNNRATMSSSDSESDSEEARLREAVDPEFNAKKQKAASEHSDKKDRSLRRDKIKNGFEAGEPVSGSGLLSVTKGFQEHVAKKLSEAIER